MNGPVKHGATSNESFIMVGKHILSLWIFCNKVMTRSICVSRMLLNFTFFLLRTLPKCAMDSWRESREKFASPLWLFVGVKKISQTRRKTQCHSIPIENITYRHNNDLWTSAETASLITVSTLLKMFFHTCTHTIKAFRCADNSLTFRQLPFSDQKMDYVHLCTCICSQSCLSLAFWCTDKVRGKKMIGWNILHIC